MAASAHETKRYFINDGDLQTVDAHAQVLIGLEKLVTQCPPSIETFLAEDESLGLFGGPCSVAYLFFKLAKPDSPYTRLILEGRSCGQWRDEYLNLSPLVVQARRDQGKHVGFPPFAQTANRQCGIWNEDLAYATLKAATSSSLDDRQKYTKIILDALPGVMEVGGDIEEDESHGGFNEYIAGRAGYLFFLRFLQKEVSPEIIPSDTIRKIIDLILSEGPIADPKRNWRWVGRPQLYLGAGHGWTGILTQILLSDSSYAATLRPILLDIISWQLEDGNWPTFVPGTCPDDKLPLNSLVQWGHGGIGTIFSLLSLRKVYASDGGVLRKLDAAVDRAQDMIWEKGLLTKEPCMAHGASGSAMCLLDPARAGHFLAHTIESKVEEGVRNGSLEPSSLSTGIHRGLTSRIWAFYCYERSIVGQYATYNDI